MDIIKKLKLEEGNPKIIILGGIVIILLTSYFFLYKEVIKVGGIKNRLEVTKEEDKNIEMELVRKSKWKERVEERERKERRKLKELEKIYDLNGYNKGIEVKEELEKAMENFNIKVVNIGRGERRRSENNIGRGYGIIPYKVMGRTEDIVNLFRYIEEDMGISSIEETPLIIEKLEDKNRKIQVNFKIKFYYTLKEEGKGKKEVKVRPSIELTRDIFFNEEKKWLKIGKRKENIKVVAIVMIKGRKTALLIYKGKRLIVNQGGVIKVGRRYRKIWIGENYVKLSGGMVYFKEKN